MNVHRARLATPASAGHVVVGLIIAALIALAQLLLMAAPATFIGSAPLIVPARGPNAPAEAAPATEGSGAATTEQDTPLELSSGPARTELGGTAIESAGGRSGQDTSAASPMGIAPSRFADLDPTARAGFTTPAPGGAFKFKPASNP